MACSVKNCKTVGPNELYVRCWMCEDEFHGKCVGLPNSFTNGLREPSYNCRWSCDSCNKKTTDFFKLFKQCRAVFLDISKDLTGIQTKLSMYEDAFKTFSVLNNSVDSPPRKKKTRSNSKSVSNAPVIDQLQIPNKGVEAMCTDNIELSPQIISVPSTSASSNLIAPPKNLVAIAPRKTIFISRLAADTSENDIIGFINKKLKNTSDVIVNKFNFSNPRLTSSFKLFVSDELFNSLLSPSFWPQNTLVKEFVYKNRKNPNIASIPKN